MRTFICFFVVALTNIVLDHLQIAVDYQYPYLINGGIIVGVVLAFLQDIDDLTDDYGDIND